MIVYDGLTNLTWFIGIVEDNVDPLKVGRVKIRAYGFHPTIEENTVDPKDLPWAPVLSGGIHMYIPIDNGELVFGAFLDGRDAQQPLVFGVIPTAKFAIPVTNRGSGGGAGDSGQVGSSAVAASYPAYGVGPLSQSDMANLSSAVLQRESSGDYASINSHGYVGGYQFGAGSLIDLGYVKQGTTNSGLNDPNNWTGQNGVGSLDTFLGAPTIQDQAFVDYAQINYDRLYSQGTITDTTPPSDVAGYITAAHLLGAGGVNSGLNNTDAFGTSGSEYFSLGSNAIINGTITGAGPAGAPVPVTNPHLLNSPEVITNFGNLALPPQATGEHQHKTPYAAAVTAVSNNHPGISFGGSHKTGVWNARYDGSYIELHAGTNSHEEHINLVHRSGTSISMDAQGNISIKSTGRVHIESDNNIDTNADGYTTNLSKGGHEIFVDGGDLTLRASGDIRLNSNSNIYLGAGKDIFMTSGGSVGISTKTMGITTDGGPINILSGQTIAIQSKAEIMAKAANMSMNIDGSLGIESKGNMTIKGVNAIIESDGSLGLKSSANTTITSDNAYIVGTQIHLNDGGSVTSRDVTQIADVPGAIPPKDKDGKETADASPPALGTTAKAKPKNPTPPPITSNSVDDVVRNA